MEKTILAFNDTPSAVRAGLLIKKDDPSIRLTQQRATIIVDWEAGQAEAICILQSLNFPFTCIQ